MSEERKTDDMEAESSEPIDLIVSGSDDKHAIQFKIHKHTRMGKLMKFYCIKRGVAINTLRFMFRATYLVDEDTPASLELEEGDTIEVFGENNLS